MALTLLYAYAMATRSVSKDVKVGRLPVLKLQYYKAEAQASSMDWALALQC